MARRESASSETLSVLDAVWELTVGMFIFFLVDWLIPLWIMRIFLVSQRLYKKTKEMHYKSIKYPYVSILVLM